MSRSGYSDDYEPEVWLWRGAVARALGGRRGQAFLRELLSTLDALPAPRLIANSFQESSGEVCALGAVGAKRGIAMGGLVDEWDEVSHDVIAGAFGIAPAMAAEIMFINDDACARAETPEHRFARVRAWVVSNLAPPPSAPS